MYYVYIIYSKSLKKRYIGKTNDLRRRFSEHNSGNSDYTSRGFSWTLIYYESFISKVDADHEEKFLKSGKGRERIKYLLSDTELQIGGVA